LKGLTFHDVGFYDGQWSSLYPIFDRLKKLFYSSERWIKYDIVDWDLRSSYDYEFSSKVKTPWKIDGYI